MLSTLALVTAPFRVCTHIPQDYGVLKNSVEYVSTVVLCWAKGKYEDHTETLKCFLSVGEKGQIPVYISTVDMRDWIISKARSIPRERFQMEPIQTDGLIHLGMPASGYCSRQILQVLLRPAACG
ncbi:hypothetical protein AGOR_G00131930 [Albula goreensis]|uniref:Uncharacterized protein n=1 Tax=Albula goreensis TaxID=1534307 RepID=A0A8T3D6I7_9TELE|nr:hypothetical protein AGOR_G00131930 [Albula goreensis]